jgi:outer membrane protein
MRSYIHSLRLCFISLFSAVIFSSVFSSCNNNYVAFINPNKLTDGYQGATIRRESLVAKAKIWQANLDSLSTELAPLPPTQTKAKEQQFLQYRQAIQQKAQAEETRVNQEILTEINAYIKQYGKEKGYDFILGATENGNIVYAAEGKDITEDVLIGLNKQYDQKHPAGK